jgi:ureidoacrylate peracid hydrolase
MHAVHIPQHVIDSVVERRGTPHPHADLDPRTTALVVVDLQNGFMMEGVAFSLCHTAVEIVPHVNRLAQTVRRTGGRVFWVQNTHDDGCLASWSHLHEMTLPEKDQQRREAMREGSQGHQLWAELDVQPEDERVLKTRYSAFIQGSSDLPERLRTQGYDTVIIVGTVTNVCCESSARDAMMLNFRTIMVSDANAAHTDEAHNATLVSFYQTFGDVMTTDFLIACLERNADNTTAA